MPLLFIYLWRLNLPWHCSKSPLLPLCSAEERCVGKGRHREEKGLTWGHAEDECQTQKQSQVSRASVFLLDFTITVKCQIRAEFHLVWVTSDKTIVVSFGGSVSWLAHISGLLSSRCDAEWMAGWHVYERPAWLRHHSQSPSGLKDISMVWLRSQYCFCWRGRRKDWVFSCLTKTKPSASTPATQRCHPVSPVLCQDTRKWRKSF